MEEEVAREEQGKTLAPSSLGGRREGLHTKKVNLEEVNVCHLHRIMTETVQYFSTLLFSRTDLGMMSFK